MNWLQYGPIAVESYLTTLAFAESPESFQCSGEFPRGEYHFTKRAHAYALGQLATARVKLLEHGIDLDADTLGSALAYITGGHGVDGLDDVDATTSDKIHAVLRGMPRAYPTFRRRRGKKEMSI